MILTWFDIRFILWFPIVWFFMVIPFLLPVIPDEYFAFSSLGISGSFGGQLRDWALNTFLIPIMPRDLALSFVQWWYDANYLKEIGTMILLSLNLFIPVSFILFWVISGYMSLINWYNKTRVETERKIART